MIGRPIASLSVMVISACVAPSAVTVDGNASSPACVATGLTNGSVCVAPNVIESVVSFAVSVSVSGVSSVTEKVAAPVPAAEIALGGVMVAWPLASVSVTVLPPTALPLLSYR